MALRWHRCFIFLALVSIIPLHATQEEQEENPLLEAARSLLENSLSGKDGFNAAGAAGLLQTFGSAFLAGNKDGGGGAAELLGQMFAGQDGGGANFDPSVLSNMVEMFTASNSKDSDDSPHGGGEQGVNWEGALGMASAFLSSQQQGGGQQQPAEALLSFLPLLMQGAGGAQNAGNVLDIALAAWKHFMQSEFAQTMWKSSGLDKITARFLDNNSKFDVHRVFESLQNHQFRRTWIRGLTSFLADWLAHIADPTSQARYASMARGILDGTLRSNGLAPFDPTRPGHSISTLVNALLRRYVGSRTDAAPYVRPAVDYLWELLQIGRSKSEGLGLARMAPREIEARMAEALNAELIEPVLRVWRAFRFARSRPVCGKYVLCEVAREAQEMPGVGLKPGVSKLASLVATWYLADDAHTSFWTLYAAATSSTNCQGHFSSGCDEFLEVDREATTKYIHNEL